MVLKAKGDRPRASPIPDALYTELLAYLQQSFEYSNRVVKTFTPQNLLNRVEGPYAGPNTRLGIAEVAVWHISDHYGQIVEYLRMNGIVPPPTRQYGLAVR